MSATRQSCRKMRKATDWVQVSIRKPTATSWTKPRKTCSGQRLVARTVGKIATSSEFAFCFYFLFRESMRGCNVEAWESWMRRVPQSVRSQNDSNSAMSMFEHRFCDLSFMTPACPSKFWRFCSNTLTGVSLWLWKRWFSPLFGEVIFSFWTGSWTMWATVCLPAARGQGALKLTASSRLGADRPGSGANRDLSRSHHSSSNGNSASVKTRQTLRHGLGTRW